MRKRELVIVAAFAVMGVVAYHLTAAPAPNDDRNGFSLSGLIDEIRRETGGGEMAAVTLDGAIPLDAVITEARISGIPHVVIQGESRTDIGYSLRVEARGPNEAAARESASRARLSEDQVGEVLSLRLNAPREGRRVASLRLTVPSALRIRVEGTQGGATLVASDVAEIQLDGVVGDAQIRGVTHLISGTHRNGELSVADAGRVDLILQNSQTVIERVRDDVRLSSRNGRTIVDTVGGPIEISAQGDETVIRRSSGLVRANGTGGSISVEDPLGEGHIDMRRTAVAMALGVAAAWTVLTTDEQLQLRLVGQPAIRLDALATDGGTIIADGIDAAPQTIDQEMRLTTTINGGTSTVALRNRRGSIVIAGTK